MNHTPLKHNATNWMNKTTPSKITPLWIIASFVSFTEVVLGVAVMQVDGGVQVALTAFVIIFPLLVASAFFLVLWFKTGVFYPPSEYGDMDPAKYVSAMRGNGESMIQETIETVKRAEQNPNDKASKFDLIYSLTDELDWQFLILMHERKIELPRSSTYVYEFENRSAGSGQLSIFGDKFKLEGTGIVETTAGGRDIRLTPEGHEFADYILKKGKKASFFWTPSGHWGTPKPGESGESYLKKRGIVLDTDAEESEN